MTNTTKQLSPDTQQALLSTLQRRATRYEVIIEHAGKTYLLGYTRKQSGRGLRELLVASGQPIASLTGSDTYTMSSTRVANVGGAFVRFSGRTQRECVCEGVWPRLA